MIADDPQKRKGILWIYWEKLEDVLEIWSSGQKKKMLQSLRKIIHNTKIVSENVMKVLDFRHRAYSKINQKRFDSGIEQKKKHWKMWICSQFACRTYPFNWCNDVHRVSEERIVFRWFYVSYVSGFISVASSDSIQQSWSQSKATTNKAKSEKRSKPDGNSAIDAYTHWVQTHSNWIAWLAHNSINHVFETFSLFRVPVKEINSCSGRSHRNLMF